MKAIYFVSLSSVFTFLLALQGCGDDTTTGSGAGASGAGASGAGASGSTGSPTSGPSTGPGSGGSGGGQGGSDVGPGGSDVGPGGAGGDGVGGGEGPGGGGGGSMEAQEFCADYGAKCNFGGAMKFASLDECISAFDSF